MRVNDYMSPLPDVVLFKEIRNSNIRDINLADYLNALFLKNGLSKSREVLKPNLAVSALNMYANKKSGVISLKNYSAALVVDNNHDLVKTLSYEMLISVAQMITCIGASQKKAVLILGEPAKALNILKKNNEMSIESINKMMDNLGEGLVFTGFKEHKVSFTKEIGSILINILKELRNKNLISSAISNHFEMCDFLIEKSLVDSPKTSEIFSIFNLSKEDKSKLYIKIINRTFNNFTIERIAENNYNDSSLKRQAGIIFNCCNFLEIEAIEVEQALLKGIEDYESKFKEAYPGLEPVYVQELLMKIPSNYNDFKDKINLLKNEDKEFNFVEKIEQILSFKVSCSDYSKYQSFVNKSFISADIEKVSFSLRDNINRLNLAKFELVEEVYLKKEKNDLKLSFVSKGVAENEKYFQSFARILIDKLLKKDWKQLFQPNDLQLFESEFIANKMKEEMNEDIQNSQGYKKKSSLVKF